MFDAHEKSCPGDEILAAFVDGTLAEAEKREVFAHVMHCRRCQDSCAFAFAVKNEEKAGRLHSLDETEKARLRAGFLRSALAEMSAGRDLWRSVREQLDRFIAMVDQARNEECEVIAAARARGRVTFAGDGGADTGWIAEMEIPAEPTDRLEIAVSDVSGRKLGGTLVLFGNELAVVGGNTSIGLEALRNSLRDPAVEFRFPDGRVQKGAPRIL